MNEVRPPFPVQISAVGCENAWGTQCNVMLFALMNDGTIRMTDNNKMFDGKWIEIPFVEVKQSK